MYQKNIRKITKEWDNLHKWSANELQTKDISKESKDFLITIGLPTRDDIFVLDATLPTFEEGVLGYAHLADVVLYEVPLYIKSNTDECWVGSGDDAQIANQSLFLFFKCLTAFSGCCKETRRLVREREEVSDNPIIKRLERLDNRLRKIDPFVWKTTNNVTGIVENYWAELTNSLRLT